MSEKAQSPNIPGYRIEGVLGRGATGVVYRARQISVDRVVALKVLHAELVGARRAEQRLQREARTTARLAHPNIISAIDMGEVDGVWWYAMEIVDGVSLQDRIREGPLTEREALRMFIPLVEALQHAFERGVVHRDIKPGNILVARDGRALLVDLGLAVADDDPLLTKSGGTLGTPHYISPEQARDPRTADVQSDLWSLGATLYHAVCGRPPFAGDSVAEILSGVLYAKIPDPGQLAPYLSRGFALVLRKCLTRERSSRYSTPAELLADLERVRERRSPLVARASLDPVVRDWRSVLRVAGLVGLVAAGLAGVWAISVLSRGNPELAADESPASVSTAALDRIAAAVAGPASGLSSAFAEVAAVERTAPLDADERARLGEIRDHLESRLASEVTDFERGVEAELERRIAEQDFEAAERQVLPEGLASALSMRIGGGELPVASRHDFDRWVARLSQRVRDGRASAEREIAGSLERHVSDTVLPQVDDLVRAGDWRAARDLLAFAPRARAAEAGVSVRGLSDADLARATEPIRTRLDERRVVLDDAWNALDAELLAWVEGRVATLHGRLVERTQQDAEAQLRADWDGELRLRGLGVDRMPLGVPRLAYEAVARGAKALADHERELADHDARLRVDEHVRSTAPLWKQRRFGEIARAYEAAGAEPWSLGVRPALTLPALEARKLEDLLARAAAGARARDGQTITLPLGTFSFTGRMKAGTDPLAQGIRLQPERGQELAFALKAPSLEASLLPGAALEVLAGLAGAQNLEPSDRLLLALFRWREGDGQIESAKAAQATLDAGPLPDADPLVADLERRILQALSRSATPQGEGRARAEEQLRLVRRETLEPGSRERKLERIKTLLASEEGLLPDELAELRGLRDALVLEGTPSTLADFEKAFLLAPERIKFPGGRPRAILRFDFAERAAGSFDPGVWVHDGIGWIAPLPARDDEDLLASAGPSLALRDPLRVQADSLEVTLLLEQPADSSPDLLFVSVAGFQVVLTSGVPPRCLVETRDAAQALARARAGQGRPCDGLRRGRRHELRILVNRAGGRAEVTLDEKRLNQSLLIPPEGEERGFSLSIRSFEPVRLLSATVEAARR
ncbi:MAG: protein kinase domain-containing protein [Planctomycetota bacterium]